MDIYTVRFTIFNKPDGITLSYSRWVQYGSAGFSDRGRLAADFPSVSILKERLLALSLPVEIAECNQNPNAIYSISEDQLAALGFSH
jgi:hypothetical protein